MKVPARLIAKTRGKQLAGSLFQSGQVSGVRPSSPDSYFLVKNEMVELDNEAANALYHRLCSQGLQFNGTQLTDDDIHYIVQAFDKYQCTFIDNFWTGIEAVK
jgi:hypothetical protein